MRTETALGAEVQLAARARQVLRQNDMGEWTRASPTLYPHSLQSRSSAGQLFFRGTVVDDLQRSGSVPALAFSHQPYVTLETKAGLRQSQRPTVGRHRLRRDSGPSPPRPRR